jgi:hypothetical protein
MSERFQLPIPMWRVHFQLLGGGRRFLSVAVICTALLVVGTFGFRRMLASDSFPRVAGFVLNFLTAIQLLIVLLGGSNALHRAMLRDYDTKMIESHRLTPMSSMAVVLGYLFGATLQVLMLFTLFLTFGVGLSVMAGLPVLDWLLGNVVLLCAGIASWAVIVFGGMRVEKPFNPAPVVVAVCALSFPISFVPSMALLLNVYTGLIAVQLLVGSGTITFVVAAIPSIVSLLFAVFWINVASVKYRRPDLPALNAFRGVALLTLFLLVGSGGLLAFEKYAQKGMSFVYDSELVRLQWITTIISALIMASIITCGAVKCRLLVSQGTAARDWSDRVSDRVVAIVAAILLCGILGGVGYPVWRTLLPPATSDAETIAMAIRIGAYTSLACVIGILTVRGMFDFVQARAKSANITVALLMIALWSIPPAADFIRGEFVRGPRDPAGYSWLLGCSPLGAIKGAWSEPYVNLLPGIIVQFVILLSIGSMTRRNRIPFEPPKV